MSIVPFFRSALRPLHLLLGLVLSAAAALAQSPSADDGYNPNVDGNVYVMATQPDGKLLVAGEFATIRPSVGDGATRKNIARLNPDGSLDTTFNPNANGPIRALILQLDGTILIGGDFTTLQPAGAAAAITRNGIARLKADGTVDTTFSAGVVIPPADQRPNITDVVPPQVNALAVQPNGKIVVGGRFVSVQASNSATFVRRNHIARFNADGSLDTTYIPNPNNLVLALVSQLEPLDFSGTPRAAHGDGKIVIAGGFTSLKPGSPDTTQAPGATGVTVRNRVARLNSDGTVDSEFDPNANNAVSTLAVQRDGKIILGGSFTTLQPVGNDSPSPRGRIARVNANGTLDSEFFPNAGGNVLSVALAPDGGILVGGYFTSVWGRGSVTSTRTYVARFNPDGSVDPAFNAGANYAVAAFAFQPDGKIVLGGYFTALQSKGLPAAVSRNRLARVNGDGTLDNTFSLDAGGRPLVSVVQTINNVPKLVIGGSFTSVGGLTRNYLARLNADGSVDSTFTPASPNGRVLAIAVQGDGKLVIGGAFNLVGTTTRNYIARLNIDGSLDTSYDPNASGPVGVLVPQDTKMLVGGSFTSFLPNGATTSVIRGYIARLDTAGVPDSFDPGANSTISAIVPQSDGKLLLAGAFTAFTPNAGSSVTSQSYIARLNTDGLVDTKFTPLVNARATSLVIQGDGKIIVGGQFTLFQPPGDTTKTTVVNGVSTTVSTAITRNRLLRLNTDGTYDPAYTAGTYDGTILALALQSDGKLIIGGTFKGVQSSGKTDWALLKYAARLNADGTLDASFNLDLSEANGNRVDSLTLQPAPTSPGATTTEEKILVGGAFTTIFTTDSNRIAAANQYVRINANGTLDTTFTPGIGGASGAKVAALSLQPDGKIVAVGSFADIGGTRTSNVARFNPEGTADTSFASSLDADDQVLAVLHRPDSNPVVTQGNGLAWLNSDGSLRTTFAPNVQLTGQIKVAVIDRLGRILLGGTFTNSNGTVGGNLVRLSATGVLDTTFAPQPNDSVGAIAVQGDGQIIVGGSFTSIGGGQTRNYIARLKDNGTVDTTFDPNASSRVNAIAIQGDGKIIIGGAFITLQPNGATTTTARAYIARLETSGIPDTAFNPTASSTVSAILIQPDGQVVIGGDFTSLTPGNTGTSYVRNYIARLKPDGTVDTFDPSASASVNALAFFPSAGYPAAGGELKIIIGGAFTALSPNSIGTVNNRNFIARLNADGTVDANFNPNANSTVNSVAVQADSSVVFAGAFTAIQPNDATEVAPRNHLARVDFSGALDTSFNPDANGAVDTVVLALILQADGTLKADGSMIVGGSLSTVRPNGVMLLGGKFKNIGGTASSYLALVNDDGTVSTAFQPKPSGPVNALLTLPGGGTLVGGEFTTIASKPRNRLARFINDGSLDNGFDPDFNGTVNAVALQGDARALVLVGGSFTTVKGAARANLVRLLPDGSADAAFAPTLPGAVRAMAVQSDGRVLVVTDSSATALSNRLSRLNADGTNDATFTPVVEASATINAIAPQADGRILVGGTFAGFLRRLNANGTTDSTYSPQPNGAVTAVTLQTDGRALIGGTFTKVGGLLRAGFARLTATTPATQNIALNAAGTGLTWTRGGTATEIAGVTFARSDDAITWTTLGTGVRATGSNAWQLTIAAQPATTNFYIRATAVVAAGGGSSSGLAQTIQELNRSNVLSDEVSRPAAVDPDPSSPAGGNGGLPPPSAPVSGFRVLADTVALNQAIAAAALATTPGSANLAHLSNLSTRASVAADNVLLTGFAISGTGERTVLVRAVGPGLTGFGVTGTISAPRLRLYDAVGNVLVENSGWAGSAAIAQAGAMSGAFPLVPGSTDAAILVTLVPGAYTIQVTDNNGAAGGVALAEVYDVAGGSASRLANVSSRSSLTAADGLLISGFVVVGSTGSENLLVRGVGPALTQFGVAGALADPTVGVFDNAGRMVAANDNWSATASTKTALMNSATSVGAFALTDGSKDAAVILTLTAGAYTTQVSAASGNPGGTLLEIYELKQ